ncbi:MAG: hypothetical protein ACTS7E_03275 [Arsenophonus sp. NC-CH8-MAG3]
MKADSNQIRKGFIRLIKFFNEKMIYLIELSEYPTDI